MSQPIDTSLPDLVPESNQAHPQNKHVIQVFRADLSQLLERSMQISVIGLFVIALVGALALGRYVFAPVAAGLIVGLTCGPVIVWLESKWIPAPIAAFAIIAAMLSAIVLISMALAVPLDTWSSRLPEIGDKLAAKWQDVRMPIDKLKDVEKKVEEATKSQAAPTEVVVKQKGLVSNVISSAGDLVARVLIFFGTLYFFLATRTSLRDAMLRFCPSMSSRLSVARIYRDIENYLSRYIGTVALINCCFGVAVGATMHLLGLPQALLWGTLAAALNFALFVGPIVMSFILLGVGLATHEEIYMAVSAPVAFVLLNLIEGQFVTPAVLGRRLTLNPLAVFVAIAFWLWLWGPLGAFLAVPLLIIVTMVLYHLMPSLERSWSGQLYRRAKSPRRLAVRLAPPNR